MTGQRDLSTATECPSQPSQASSSENSKVPKDHCSVVISQRRWRRSGDMAERQYFPSLVLSPTIPCNFEEPFDHLFCGLRYWLQGREISLSGNVAQQNVLRPEFHAWQRDTDQR